MNAVKVCLFSQGVVWFKQLQVTVPLETAHSAALHPMHYLNKESLFFLKKPNKLSISNSMSASDDRVAKAVR